MWVLGVSRGRSRVPWNRVSGGSSADLDTTSHGQGTAGSESKGNVCVCD